MYPCGEINVSEKSVAKSCVAKLSVAKSMYTGPDTPPIPTVRHPGTLGNQLVYYQRK